MKKVNPLIALFAITCCIGAAPHNSSGGNIDVTNDCGSFRIVYIGAGGAPMPVMGAFPVEPCTNETGRALETGDIGMVINVENVSGSGHYLTVTDSQGNTQTQSVDAANNLYIFGIHLDESTPVTVHAH